MIAIDAGGLFDGIFNNTLQETLLILIHEVTRSKHKSIIKKGFHRYLNKVKKTQRTRESFTNCRKDYFLHCMTVIQSQ